MKIPQEKLCSIPKIELHIHLEGAIRFQTLFELMTKKSMTLPGDGSYEDFKRACIVIPPGESLEKFLGRFEVYFSSILGDLEAIERIAYELCEDQAKNNVIYFEVRFSPHLLSATHGLPADEAQSMDDPNAATPSKVIECALKGLKRGEKDFNVKSRLILCCIHGKEWYEEVVNLCLKYQDQHVVGIDTAGSEQLLCTKTETGVEVEFPEECIAAYKKAYENGIHRTVHACEAGPAEVGETAIEMLHAERIGHGYHIVENESTYQTMLEKQVHLECCPQSSYCTGSVRMDVEHPLVRFAKDKMNFSLSSDDPTVTGTRLTDDLIVAKKFGLSDDDLVRSMYNAARASFLPEDEKLELIQKLDEALSGKYLD